jgi:antitoxin (DNA-binding transcriptional repressor) of toxin-antitoxin stability system
MKSVSIDELHQSTESIVRAASNETTLVTDAGQVVAVIDAANAISPGRRFPAGHWESVSRPQLRGDSTETVSADRNR